MPRKPTIDKIESGLMAVVAEGNNLAAASRRSGVPAATLKAWRDDRYPEMFSRLKERYEREVEDQVVASARRNALAAAEAIADGIQATHDGIRDGSIRDPARASADLARVMGQSVDRVLAMTGRPISPTDGGLNGMSLVKSLVEAGILNVAPGTVVDSTATEMPVGGGGDDTGQPALER